MIPAGNTKTFQSNRKLIRDETDVAGRLKLNASENIALVEAKSRTNCEDA